jgi:hypothetical protein
LTALTGVYGDKFGVPIGNSFGLFDQNAIASTFPSSFTYWTDVLADGTPEMLARNGKNAPAPWVPFTRAGCNLGAFSVANIEFENTTTDIDNVFGPNSPEHQENVNNHNKAVADFEGIIVHCAKGTALCANKGAPEILKDEPGGYNGFTALYGNGHNRDSPPRKAVNGEGRIPDNVASAVAERLTVSESAMIRPSAPASRTAQKSASDTDQQNPARRGSITRD